VGRSMSAVATSSRDAVGRRLSCQDVEIEVGGRSLVRRLSLAFATGRITAILGRNGVGKTLSLHTLAGLRATRSGQVLLDDVPLERWARRARARSIGLLTQTSEDTFPSTALEAVLVGRHPHLGFWDWESGTDRAIAAAALSTVGLEGFEDRDIATLSGGERRRVALAALLAQDPQIYLLDEPTNHLDPHHQILALELMRDKASRGRTVVMTLHDPSLAARFCDDALLLFGNGEWLYGSTSDILTPAAVSRLYGVPVQELRWAGGRAFVMGG